MIHIVGIGTFFDLGFIDHQPSNELSIPNNMFVLLLETYPKKFSAGQFATYDLPKANITEPVAEAIVVVGFKTSEPNVALAQITGDNHRHFSVALIGG